MFFILAAVKSRSQKIHEIKFDFFNKTIKLIIIEFNFYL